MLKVNYDLHIGGILPSEIIDISGLERIINQCTIQKQTRLHTNI